MSSANFDEKDPIWPRMPSGRMRSWRKSRAILCSPARRRTTLLLSFRNSEQVEMVSQEQADFILGLLGKTRTLNYDGVQQELRVENIPPAFWPLFAASVDYWLGNEQKRRHSRFSAKISQDFTRT